MSKEIEHKKLIKNSINGNTKAFKKLYQLYADAMYNCCLRILNNTDEAKDVLQDAFIEIYKHLSNFNYESSFGIWAKKICINKSLNQLKKNKYHQEFIEQHKDNITDYETNEINETNLKIDKIKKAMQILPTGSRTIFSLFAFEGYDYQEISQIMNLSEGNCRIQYHRAKNKIIETINNL